jgi:hypothetical protein
MSNSYLQFSEEIGGLSADEAQWCAAFLRQLRRSGSIDFEYGFQQEAGQAGTTLWLQGDETLSDTLTDFVQRFLAAHRPDQCIVISYAATCSEMLPGAFGGGKVFITADSITWSDDAQCLAAQVAAFKRSRGSEAQPTAALGEVGATALVDRVSWFIIDTDQPAHPFHRELAAYVVGATPLWGSNLDEADASPYLELLARGARQAAAPDLDWTEEAVAHLPTEDGIRTPVRCAATPGWVLDGVGHAYRVDQIPPGAEARLSSFQSVAISFERPLTAAEVKQLQERAQAFVRSTLYQRGDGGAPVVITGFRLVESATVDTCTDVLAPG